MNKEMLKEVMNDMDVIKELDEYGKNKLATVYSASNWTPMTELTGH